MGTTVVRNLQVKEIVGNTAMEPNADGSAKWLVRFAGVATDHKEESHPQYGVSYRFSGQFSAINFETGEVFESTQMFIPKTVAGMLAHQVTEGKKTTGYLGSQCLFDIGIKPAKQRGNNSAKYEYVTRNPASDSDAITKNLLQYALPAGVKQKQLESPKA